MLLHSKLLITVLDLGRTGTSLSERFELFKPLFHLLHWSKVQFAIKLVLSSHQFLP